MNTKLFYCVSAVVVAAVSFVMPLPVFAAYDDEDSSYEDSDRDVLEPPETDDFNSVVDVDRYLQGNVKITTLAMIRDVGTQLHKENMKTHEELQSLKREVTRLAEEVRRLSAGGSRR